jgi:hypothetical protein
MIAPLQRCAIALGLVMMVASPIAAQDARVAPKWLGWIGCWTASVPGTSAIAPPTENGTFVCITPSSRGGDAVDVTTIGDGKVVSTQRIDASGVERPLEQKGCTGVQRASWSADGRRIYLRSASTCDGLKSTTSAILSITASGEWLDVHGVSSYGSENLRVARYRDAGIPASVPAEVASVLRERSAGTDAARIVTGARIGAPEVIEASRAADSTVVAAWLLEREQRFSLDARTLIQLADAGVPGAVTDAMVAVSNPGAFHLARVSGQSDAIVTDIDTLSTRRRTAVRGIPIDPWSWGSYGSDAYLYGYPYGFRSRYGGYGYGYGNGYNNGYYGGYAPPIIIVRGGAQDAPAGQMVKGRGYTQPGGSSPGPTARERPSRSPEPPPPSSSGSSSSGSSSGASSSGGSSGGSSDGRTAKPRP